MKRKLRFFDGFSLGVATTLVTILVLLAIAGDNHTPILTPEQLAQANCYK